MMLSHVRTVPKSVSDKPIIIYLVLALPSREIGPELCKKGDEINTIIYWRFGQRFVPAEGYSLKMRWKQSF
jgi:hypothetical protein